MLFAVLVALLVGALSALLFWRSSSGKPASGGDAGVGTASAGARKGSYPPAAVRILFASTTGKTEGLANALAAHISALPAPLTFTPTLTKLPQFNPELLEKDEYVVLLMPTWTDGTAPDSATGFAEWLADAATDFRVSKGVFGNMKFAAFGLGDTSFGKNYCKCVKVMDREFAALGATRLLPVGFGDDSTDFESTFDAWKDELLQCLQDNRARVLGLMAPAPEAADASSHSGSRKPAGAAGDDGVGYLPLKEYRRQRRAQKEAQEKEDARAARKAAAAAAAAATAPAPATPAAASTEDVCCGGSGGGGGEACCKSAANASAPKSHSGGDACCKAPAKATSISDDEDDDDDDDDDVEETEEDRINNELLMVGGEEDEDDDDDAEEDEEPSSFHPPEVNGCGAAGDDDDGNGTGMVDLEDLGKVVARRRVGAPAADAKAVDLASLTREMVTPAQRKALTKEGYKLIGSHSAVKLCRWTKAQLRGRGGCYKHTFYGITSYQCMETTPSLACANKCVFCWRHHKNPVGKEWRWKVDPPELIVSSAIEQHVAMIKQLRSVPGVKMERWSEAHTVRHCALSLVGEPIMYPYINEFIKLLHDREISSFLVTNAQFPEQIESLNPVTQLYVSIDAATRDSLKAVDRPLFKDFWERYIASLTALRQKRQRTVYRLTLVKAYNMDEVAAYAKLIDVGQPDFIEVKAVTYCGKSDGSSLTMANVPWHEEVRRFCEALCDYMGGAYGLAAEHAHSCCVLMAKPSFRVDGVWHTWINYPKFHELSKAFYASGGTKTFTSADYMAATPEWAVYNAKEGGFDPVEARYRRNKEGAVIGVEYKEEEAAATATTTA